MKEIKERNETNYSRRITQGRKITLTTNDHMRYVFWDLPWYDYPIYSHREIRVKSDTQLSIGDRGGVISRISTNYRLPTVIRKAIFEDYGGYYMAEGQVKFVEEQKNRMTILKAEVGDMCPLRTPDENNE